MRVTEMSENKRPLTRYERIMKGKVVLSEIDKEKIWKLVKDPDFNELKEPRDHGRLWFKCSGAYA
jgi:hypothetical protein